MTTFSFWISRYSPNEAKFHRESRGCLPEPSPTGVKARLGTRATFESNSYPLRVARFHRRSGLGPFTPLGPIAFVPVVPGRNDRPPDVFSSCWVRSPTAPVVPPVVLDLRKFSRCRSKPLSPLAYEDNPL